MKMRKLLKLLVFILILSSSLGCRDGGIVKLKSSGRRVYSEMRYLDKTSEDIMTSLGMKEKNEMVDTTQFQFTSMRQKNFINEYSFLYDALNGGTTNAYLQNLNYDSTSQNYIQKVLGNRKLQEGKEVYTWHPYWMGDVWQSYNFDLISTIVYFAYKVNPETGSYLNQEQIQQWNETALIDSAKMHNTKVLLTIALEGGENNESFLKDESRWNVLLDSVAVLLKNRDADGIEIDFSGITEKSSGKFISLVESLKDNLDYRFIKKKMYVSVVMPANPKDFPVDLKQLEEFVDLFVIKGIDYHEIDPSLSIVAPLRTDVAGGYSLENTLSTYLKRGLLAEKSILALPLYGTQWSGSWQSQKGFYETDFQKKVTLSEVQRLYNSRDTLTVFEPNLDELTMTNYLLLEFSDNTSIECWYDDSKTLSIKMDLALSRGFKGVGLWALGYDLGLPDVWEVIENKFTGDEVYIKDPIAEIEGYPIQIAAFLHKYERLFAVTFALVTFCLFFALTLAFSDWRFRDTLLAKQLYRILFLLVCLIALLPLLSYVGVLQEGNWRFVLLFFLGAIASYLIQKYGGMIKSDKP